MVVKPQRTCSRQPTMRSKTPEYSTQELEDELGNYVRKVGTGRAFYFGVYNAIPLNFAARGKGLTDLHRLVETLLKVGRHMQFKHTDLKRAVTQVWVHGIHPYLPRAGFYSIDFKTETTRTHPGSDRLRLQYRF